MTGGSLPELGLAGWVTQVEIAEAELRAALVMDMDPEPTERMLQLMTDEVQSDDDMTSPEHFKEAIEEVEQSIVDMRKRVTGAIRESRIVLRAWRDFDLSTGPLNSRIQHLMTIQERMEQCKKRIVQFVGQLAREKANLAALNDGLDDAQQKEEENEKFLTPIEGLPE